MKLDFIKRKPRKSIVMMAIFVAILFSLAIYNTFSNTTDSSAWDGIVANNFSGGTGTINNPYIISNASQFGYFKELLESEEAISYLDKHYVLTSSFNYGNYDMSINNNLPFSGSIDGRGHTITNITITNNLFNSIDGSIIKNISLNNINYTLTNETGGVISNSANEASFNLVLVDGDVSIDETTTTKAKIHLFSRTCF